MTVDALPRTAGGTGPFFELDGQTKGKAGVDQSDVGTSCERRAERTVEGTERPKIGRAHV